MNGADEAALPMYFVSHDTHDDCNLTNVRMLGFRIRVPSMRQQGHSCRLHRFVKRRPFDIHADQPSTSLTCDVQTNIECMQYV